MLLAEFEIRHSRAIAPTRRVALGDLWLPTDRPPGFGGILLAGVVAASVNRIEEEEREGLDALLAYDERWALKLLGFHANTEPARSQILKRFRKLLFEAHPDHGGSSDEAGTRISELTEAKRILLAEVD